MKKPIKLINLEDLKIILHVDDETIVQYIEKGMPHYYFEDTMYFNFNEAMDWICSCIDLGFLHNESRSLLAEINYFLEKKDFSFDSLLKAAETFRYAFAKEPNCSVTMFIYRKLRSPFLPDFVKIVKKLYPSFSDKQILSYYLGMAYDHYNNFDNDISSKDSLF